MGSTDTAAAAAERLERPARDEQQDEQEQHPGQRGRERGQRDGRPELPRAGPSAASRDGAAAPPPRRSRRSRSPRRCPTAAIDGGPGVARRAVARLGVARCHRAVGAGQQRRGGGDRAERQLDQEDRAPVERLRQRAAERGPDRGAEHRGADPQPVAPQVREPGDERRRRAERLQRAEGEHRSERIRQRAQRPGDREHAEPGHTERARPAPGAAATPRAGQRHGEHDRVHADDGGHALDGRVEVDEHRRQRERDHRGIGERQADADGDEHAQERHRA